MAGDSDFDPGEGDEWDPPGGSGLTDREREQMKREMRSQERQVAQAYRAGVEDSSPNPPSGRPRTPPSRQRGGASGPGVRLESKAEQGAQFIVGLLAYAVAVNWIRGGTPQVKQWFAAKFYNSTGAPVAPQQGNPQIQGGPTPSQPSGGSGGSNSANGANGNTGPGGTSPSGNGQPVYQAGSVATIPAGALF